MLWFDPLILARIQFAFTVSFHIIFPAFTIGLASFLAMVEFLWLYTCNNTFLNIYRFWIKIFAVAFGMGVVSGVTMSYQFGTNWSVFSDRVSNVIGPLLGYEVLTAFFLESSFLGVMLFGIGRVSKLMHFVATCIVASGTLLSAFWILSANSWMQTPDGFIIAKDGLLHPTDWWKIVFNPSFLHRYAHMVIAAYLTSSFVIGGVAALYLLQKRFEQEARIMLGMSVIMAALAAPLQLVIGHEHGNNTLAYQPLKIAAIEANWAHESSAPLVLFGIPDQLLEKNHYEISIPFGASWVLTGDPHGKIPAIKNYKKEDRPFVLPIFFCFRIMVGIGVLMILTGTMSTIQYFRGGLYNCKLLLIWWVLMSPAGFIALLAGWFVTEMGRQPWTVYGIIRTAESVTPAIIGPQIAWSLASFVIMYSFVFGAGVFYIVKLISKGIEAAEDPEQFYKHSIEASGIEGKK
ncbi:MAG: cytochrome ubiquinol oxidase subunit I [Rickettsiaceae bacterium]|nr:cytochrome ubiquinol oxidase subunit I [Rickettsiaceae bacterium]